MSAVKARPGSKKKSQKPVFTLNEAHSMVVAAMGDNSQKYFKHVQEWFKLRTSKDVIDNVARRYLKHDRLMLYHDTFILTLLNKVGGLNEKSQAAANQIVFPDGLVCPRMSKHYRPVSPVLPLVEHGAQLNPNAKFDQNGKVAQNDPSISLPMKTPPLEAAVKKAQDACLPSQALMHGRFILTSWDNGLQGVHSDAAELMLEATKTFLKNVLIAIVHDIKPCKRSTWTHMYQMETDTSKIAKEIWCKEGEGRVLIDQSQMIPVMYLWQSVEGPDYQSTTSYGPQPEEADTTLMACNVFNSLRRNPKIIPVESILNETIMRVSRNMRQSADDKIMT